MDCTIVLWFQRDDMYIYVNRRRKKYILWFTMESDTWGEMPKPMSLEEDRLFVTATVTRITCHNWLEKSSVLAVLQ